MLFISSSYAYASYDQHFTGQTMRIDYIHAGDHNSEQYYIKQIKKEPFWGGSNTHLIDTFKYGSYFFEVYDEATSVLLYSRGYSSLFKEWQTTTEATTMNKAFYESVVFPFPKNKVVVKWYSRNKKGQFKKQLELIVDPNDYFINPTLDKIYPVYTALHSGDPHNKVDIVILPDGYTKDEMDLFKSDCDRFANELFEYQPYNKFKDAFNIVGVLAPSKDSGNDIPAENIWKNTQVNTSFYTFDSDRYCMTEDFKSVRDLAANVPYDQIYILVNNEKYGGGAIYNFYNVSVNSNAKAGQIFIHELGHGFVGLADEYYTSSTSYSDFYNLDVEPWEPNITTLVDFDSKWKPLLAEDTPIPTPSTKDFEGVLGVYEGGGYVAKGIYRPRQDCLMKTFNDTIFCGACEQAIIKMIQFYTE
ncbi:MAG: peptidase M64 [Bacteroidales bacterium]|nr:peptidase M64 [Bacteroidales bacterium]